jgi:hypothetical protein
MAARYMKGPERENGWRTPLAQLQPDQKAVCQVESEEYRCVGKRRCPKGRMSSLTS